jgi:hypothetical protein
MSSYLLAFGHAYFSFDFALTPYYYTGLPSVYEKGLIWNINLFLSQWSVPYIVFYVIFLISIIFLIYKIYKKSFLGVVKYITCLNLIYFFLLLVGTILLEVRWYTDISLIHYLFNVCYVFTLTSFFLFTQYKQNFIRNKVQALLSKSKKLEVIMSHLYLLILYLSVLSGLLVVGIVLSTILPYYLGI